MSALEPVFRFPIHPLWSCRRVGYHAARTLGGAKPAGLAIAQPGRYERVLTMKTARTLGLKIPASIALRVYRTIERQPRERPLQPMSAESARRKIRTAGHGCMQGPARAGTRGSTLCPARLVMLVGAGPDGGPDACQGHRHAAAPCRGAGRRRAGVGVPRGQ